MQLAIAKGETCQVKDKPEPIKWTVVTSAGQRGNAPSIIFTLPPPSPKCIARAQALERSFVTFMEHWIERHRRIQLIVNIHLLQRNIKYITTWTLESVCFIFIFKSKFDYIMFYLVQNYVKGRERQIPLRALTSIEKC